MDRIVVPTSLNREMMTTALFHGFVEILTKFCLMKDQIPLLFIRTPLCQP
jgi:hypothetical protein